MSEAEGQEWVMIGLDEKMAQRQGMPFRVPVPKEKFEGLADDGLTGDKLREWIKDFLTNSELAKDGNWRRRNSSLVSQLEGFVDKTPLWEKAQALFAKGEFDTALKTLKRITVMCPDDHAAKMNYGSALANQGQYDKAFKQLKQLRESFDGDPDYHVNIAQIHVMRGDQDAAIEQLLKALEAKPDCLPAMSALEKLGLLVSIYEDPRDAASMLYVRADSVLEYLQEQWSSEERDADYYLEQMGYHESQRRYHVAFEAAERAIAASGDSINERAEQGKISSLRSMGKSAEALAAARGYAERAPESAAAQVELASTLQKVGKTDEASAVIDKALELDPGDQMALVLKFWPEDRGDLMAVQEAMPGLKAWADSHSEVPGALRSLARAKLVTDNAEEALGLLSKAVDLSPDDDDLRSEWWAELALRQMHEAVIEDSKRIENMGERDWRLRWNEAEGYRGLGKIMEARACYMQINADKSLHVDIRKRAKRAAMDLGAPAGGDPPAES